jgi:hypothetical protein
MSQNDSVVCSLVIYICIAIVDPDTASHLKAMARTDPSSKWPYGLCGYNIASLID